MDVVIFLKYILLERGWLFNLFGYSNFQILVFCMIIVNFVGNYYKKSAFAPN